MSEQDEVLAAFNEAGVLGGIRWAYVSAIGRVFMDYSEATGHDATWVGITRFTLLRDRLDRVFACGRYSVPEGSDSGVSPDVLHAELTEQDVATMPRLESDLVVRANLNGSPGWAWQRWRWLMASCAFGKVDQLPWPQRSPTKQRVARQPNPDPDQASLFDELADEEIGGLEQLLAAAHQLDRETLVVAHTQDVEHDGRELVIGRPRLNVGGGDAWHWRHNVLTAPPAYGGRRSSDTPDPIGPDSVPDASVRLRPPAAGEQGDRETGEA